jgi:anti-sigma regulatory factor (Ser/Thr protein kinase)
VNVLASATLPAAVTTPAAARAFVKDAAPRLPVRLDDLTLVVSELVTNAVVHGAGDVDLHVGLERDVVHVEVSDGGPEDPLPEQPEDSGLLLVSRLAQSWGIRRDGDRTVLWADLAAV